MSENVEVRGDVAQLIGGNVNEAPRQNNVVNFHLTGESAAELMLTDLQRKRISTLVKELCAVTHEQTLDVYRVILTDFGAERIKELPRAKYREVVAVLEQWIAENKQGSARTEAAKPLQKPAEAGSPSISLAHICDTCREKDTSYAHLQRISRGQWMLTAFLAVSCALLLYKMPAPADAASAAEHNCFYIGKPYSAGSTIKVSGTIRECISESQDEPPHWERIK